MKPSATFRVVFSVSPLEARWVRQVLTAARDYDPYGDDRERLPRDPIHAVVRALTEESPDVHFRFEIARSPDAAGGEIVRLTADEDGDPNQLGILLRELLKVARPESFFAVPFAIPDPARPSGGALLVTAERILVHDVHHWLHQSEPPARTAVPHLKEILDDDD
jgi:transglutaminase-like putative cysteine protease